MSVLFSTITTIRAQLAESNDTEQSLLWDVFVKFDNSLDGKVDKSELKEMLRSFEAEGNENVLKRHLRHDGTLSFPDFVAWWEGTKKEAAHHNEMETALRNQLSAKFSLAKVQGLLSLFSSSPIQDRIESTDSTFIKTISVPAYSEIATQVSSWTKTGVGFANWYARNSFGEISLFTAEYNQPKCTLLADLHTYIYLSETMRDDEESGRCCVSDQENRAIKLLIVLSQLLLNVRIIFLDEENQRRDINSSESTSFSFIETQLLSETKTTINNSQLNARMQLAACSEEERNGRRSAISQFFSEQDLITHCQTSEQVVIALWTGCDLFYLQAAWSAYECTRNLISIDEDETRSKLSSYLKRDMQLLITTYCLESTLFSRTVVVQSEQISRMQVGQEFDCDVVFIIQMHRLALAEHDLRIQINENYSVCNLNCQEAYESSRYSISCWKRVFNSLEDQERSERKCVVESCFLLIVVIAANEESCHRIAISELEWDRYRNQLHQYNQILKLLHSETVDRNQLLAEYEYNHPCQITAPGGSIDQLISLNRFQRDSVKDDELSFRQLQYQTAMDERDSIRNINLIQNNVLTSELTSREQLLREKFIFDEISKREYFEIIFKEISVRSSVQSYAIEVLKDLIFNVEPNSRITAAINSLIVSETIQRLHLIGLFDHERFISFRLKHRQHVSVSRNSELHSRVLWRRYFQNWVQFPHFCRIRRTFASKFLSNTRNCIRSEYFNKFKGFVASRKRFHLQQLFSSTLLKGSNKQIYLSAFNRFVANREMAQKKRKSKALSETFLKLTRCGYLKLVFEKLRGYSRIRRSNRSHQNLLTAKLLLASDRGLLLRSYLSFRKYVLHRQSVRNQNQQRQNMLLLVSHSTTTAILKYRYNSWLSSTLRSLRRSQTQQRMDGISFVLLNQISKEYMRYVFNKFYKLLEIRRRQQQRDSVAHVLLTQTGKGHIRWVFGKFLRFAEAQQKQKQSLFLFSKICKSLLQSIDRNLIRAYYGKWMYLVTASWRKGTRLKTTTATVFLAQCERGVLQYRYAVLRRFTEMRRKRSTHLQLLSTLTDKQIYRQVFGKLFRFSQQSARRKAMHTSLRMVLSQSNCGILLIYYQRLIRNKEIQSRKRCFALAWSTATEKRTLFTRYTAWVSYKNRRLANRMSLKAAHAFFIGTEVSHMRTRFVLLRTFARNKRKQNAIQSGLTSMNDTFLLRRYYNKLKLVQSWRDALNQKIKLGSIMCTTTSQTLLRRYYLLISRYADKCCKQKRLCAIFTGLSEKAHIRSVFQTLVRNRMVGMKRNRALRAAGVLSSGSDRMLLNLYYIALLQNYQKKIRSKRKCDALLQLMGVRSSRYCYECLRKYSEMMKRLRSHASVLLTLSEHGTRRVFWGKFQRFHLQNSMQQNKTKLLSYEKVTRQAETSVQSLHKMLIISEGKTSILRKNVFLALRESSNYTLLRRCFDRLGRLGGIRKTQREGIRSSLGFFEQCESTTRDILVSQETAEYRQILFLSVTLLEATTREKLIIEPEAAERGDFTSACSSFLSLCLTQFIRTSEETTGRLAITNSQDAVRFRLSEHYQVALVEISSNNAATRQIREFAKLEFSTRNITCESEHHNWCELKRKCLVAREKTSMKKIKTQIEELEMKEEAGRELLFIEETRIREICLEGTESKERKLVSGRRKKRDAPFVGLEITDGSVKLRDGTTVDYLPSGCKVKACRGPAASAGIIEGDLIMAIDGLPITDLSAFKRTMASFSPGDTMLLKYMRRSKVFHTNIAVGSASDHGKSSSWVAGKRHTEHTAVRRSSLSPRNSIC